MNQGVLKNVICSYKQEPCQSLGLGRVRLLLILIALMLGLSACGLKQKALLRAKEQSQTERSQKHLQSLDLSQLEEKDLVLEEVHLLYDSTRLKELSFRRQEMRGRTKALHKASEEVVGEKKEVHKLQLEEQRAFKLQESFGLRQGLAIVLGLIIGLLIAKLLRK